MAFLTLFLVGVWTSQIWQPRTWILIRDKGTVGRAFGCMAIYSENDVRYDHYEVVNLPSEFQRRGTQVWFVARRYNGASFCMWGKMIEIVVIKEIDRPLTSLVLTSTGWKILLGMSLIVASLLGIGVMAWFYRWKQGK